MFYMFKLTFRKKKLLLSFFLCLHEPHIYRCPGIPEDRPESLQQELQGVVSHPMEVVGNKLRSSKRGVTALGCRAISLAPGIDFSWLR